MDAEMAKRFMDQYMPSSNAVLLRTLIDAKIENLIRYSWWPPEEAVQKYENVPVEMAFSLTMGHVLMYLDDGRVIGFGDNPPLKIVTVWVENGESHKEDLNDKHLLSALDARYAPESIRRVIGKRIVRIHVLKRDVKRTDRPFEVGVEVEVEGGHHFIFAHGLYDDYGSFCVITREQILDSIEPELYDLLVVE